MKICDRATAVVKLFNVVFYGGYACWYFYSPLLLRWRGVPSGLIGAVLAVRPVVGAAITPLWTALADASGWHQTLHVTSLVIGGLSRVLYRAAPTSAAPLLAAAVASEVLTCHMTPLGDTAVVVGLKRLGRPQDEYSQQLLWGAVGAGWIFMPLAGALLRGRSHDTSWLIALALHIGMMLISASMASCLWNIGRRSKARVGGEAAAPAAAAAEPRGRWRGALREVRPSLHGCARCVLFFWCGFFHAATEGYLFLYLDALGASTMLDGLAILFTCLSEVAVMAVAGRLISRLGLDGCLVLIFACYLLRFLAYVALAQPWCPSLYLVLPAQLLHGVTFGLYWSAGVHWAAASAPDGLAATFQGAFAALRDGGATLALLAGGMVLDRVGGEGLYAGAALAAACAALAALALVGTTAVRRRRTSGLLRGVTELSSTSTSRGAGTRT